VGVYWACDTCGGRTVAVSVLRKVVAEDQIRQLWTSAHSASPGQKRCPTCSHPMCEATAGRLRLDVCKICQFVWFDAHEFEQMPAATIAPQPAELPQPVREAIALYQVQQRREELEAEGPVETWQQVPAVFGLPVECDAPALAGYPAITWTVAFCVIVASIAGFLLGQSRVHEFAFVPSEAFRYGGLTMLTSFFLHGGIIHLVGNLYFLLIFGDNVEDYLGRRRFALMLLGATIAGDLLHWAGEPRGELPTIGASGGISGIITFYALKFPHAKLGLYLRAFYRLHWVRFPAWAGLLLWAVLQLFGALQQLAGFSHVSALAHLGGAAMGFALWLAWGRSDGAAPTA